MSLVQYFGGVKRENDRLINIVRLFAILFIFISSKVYLKKSQEKKFNNRSAMRNFDSYFHL
jgi:hypothetical protein